ncbi:cell wall-binding repeat-containing protein [Candidatus Poriferisodalis sp.]|uniref:cell wall-binding repeat-containing protein n=1 Tax=Candidatus Poriferisodalis sp. TaxID=3101277 RepID=UPI003C6F55BF
MAAATLTIPLTAAPAEAQPGSASPPNGLGAVEILRYGGADRYATSLLVAEAFAAHAGGSLDTVVLASGRHWTDAVVAASLAGDLGAPVLMTPPDELRSDAADFLDRVGASRAVIVSTAPFRQPSHVSEAVSDSLAAAGLAVERVSGNNQYRTGVAVARSLSDVGEIAGFGRTAIVASGEVFADALVAGPLAAHGPHPVLLTPKAVLHVDVAAYLESADIDHVILMGGLAALSPAVESSIRSIGISVARMAGATRFETAAEFGNYAADRSASGCFSGDQVGLARAYVPFDSFSAAPLLAQRCAAAVLTEPTHIPSATVEFIDAARSDSRPVTLSVFGGGAAVAQATLDGYLAANPVAGAKHYKNRSERSMLPAEDKYFIDHGEVAALFPECGPPPEYHPNTIALNNSQMALYGGFDREVTPGAFGSTTIDFTTGWWTDETLYEVYKNTYPEIDVAWAKQHVTMWNFGQIGFGWRPHLQGPDWMKVPSAGNPVWRGLYDRIAMDGFVSDAITGAEGFADHYGIRNPRRVDPNDALWIDQGGRLLWDWMGFMIQFPPVDREPAVWGMHTLLTTRHPKCVAQRMLAMCDDPLTTGLSPHLRHDQHASPLGWALRNLICGQRPITT